MIGVSFDPATGVRARFQVYELRASSKKESLKWAREETGKRTKRGLGKGYSQGLPG